MDTIILIGLLLVLLYFYINRGNLLGSTKDPSQKEIQGLDYVKEKEEICNTNDIIVLFDEKCTLLDKYYEYFNHSNT